MLVWRQLQDKLCTCVVSSPPQCGHGIEKVTSPSLHGKLPVDLPVLVILSFIPEWCDSLLHLPKTDSDLLISCVFMITVCMIIFYGSLLYLRHCETKPILPLKLTDNWATKSVDTSIYICNLLCTRVTILCMSNLICVCMCVCSCICIPVCMHVCASMHLVHLCVQAYRWI